MDTTMIQLRVPAVVFKLICLHLRIGNAQGTLVNVALASRASFEVAAPHIYRDLYIDADTLPSILLGLMTPPTLANLELPKSRFPWENEEKEEKGQKAKGRKDFKPEEQKKMIKEYLESIGGSTCKLPISLVDLDTSRDYPNPSSHARKIALLARVVRLVIMDYPTVPDLVFMAHIATTTQNILLPSVAEMVLAPPVGTDPGPLSRHLSSAALRFALRQSALPRTMCQWYHPFNGSQDQVLAEGQTATAELNSLSLPPELNHLSQTVPNLAQFWPQLAELLPSLPRLLAQVPAINPEIPECGNFEGRLLGSALHHNLKAAQVDIVSPAHNRCFFGSEVNSPTININEQRDAISEALAMPEVALMTLLSETMKLHHEATSIELIDVGFLAEGTTDITARSVEQRIVSLAVQDLTPGFEKSGSGSNPLPRTIKERITVTCSGEAAVCEACDGLPYFTSHIEERFYRDE